MTLKISRTDFYIWYFLTGKRGKKNKKKLIATVLADLIVKGGCVVQTDFLEYYELKNLPLSLITNRSEFTEKELGVLNDLEQYKKEEFNSVTFVEGGGFTLI